MARTSREISFAHSSQQKELEQEAAAFSTVATDVPDEQELADEEDDDEQVWLQ